MKLNPQAMNAMVLALLVLCWMRCPGLVALINHRRTSIISGA
jgi:hypothetical protein